ncbi:SusD/RagB family nutrient-binding outer membrane lipoprotein [Pedobacter aquatilis]|uniref:SusD/RagB family nutrient-binding outer membrane lipoprotein n=1 Tax=Pedobacter aquatilis TaxID=351343 RepID=UPI00292DB587|nr:SusD/RagB family nutrient-binding outer membrane lipoprotein [Pedobacter aquatilis]
MKNIFKNSTLLIAAAIAVSSCKKFDDVNVSPTAATADQVQVEYFLNNSIIQAQMNPDVAERSFILYWKTAAHQHRNGGLSSGTYNDGWTIAYYNQVADWLNSANTGIQIGEKQIADNNIKVYTRNLVQIGRIWRAYLVSEMSDNFGPVPINAFNGTNPEFADVKSVYYYCLAELKDAVSKIDETVVNPGNLANLDPAYGYNYDKWKRYANSLRMRLAMRLSEVDAAKAKTEFEDAATGAKYITTADQMFKVAEKGGWDALTGVMSREWNAQFLSTTLNNIYIGLGGIQSQNQLDASFASAIKPANYIGVRYSNQFTSRTNDPSTGYWLDGLPNVIDPRAYKTFIVPGDFTNPNFNSYPSWTSDAKNTQRNLLDGTGAVVKTIEAKNTWNTGVTGDWGTKGSQNQLLGYEGTTPRLSNQFRASASQRIWFASWETYFLLAEASVRGWTVPMGGQAAYEAGVKASFDYWGVSAHAAAYLTSTSFSRTGTSVSWTHVTEPAASYTMNYVDGYTNVAGTANIVYPKNDLYKSGTVKNDQLTKIITQKYIAQMPWLPLEAWSDQRRLGLPFFENPAIENNLPNLPALNTSSFMTSSVNFFPQRLRYPSSLPNTNSKGYAQAVTALGGADAVLTPLWWAKKP